MNTFECICTYMKVNECKRKQKDCLKRSFQKPVNVQKQQTKEKIKKLHLNNVYLINVYFNIFFNIKIPKVFFKKDL